MGSGNDYPARRFANAPVRLGAWLVLIVLTLASGCAERAEEPGLEIHPDGWNEAGDAGFHGAVVRTATASSCDVCHDVDGEGDDEVPGCLECHAGVGGHPQPWSAATQHGGTVREGGPDD
ncbi:hypothetical protein H8E07_17000 [bacterium]|nr:hypothetical protein [bacterium]